jgi:hypothetical protein
MGRRLAVALLAAVVGSLLGVLLPRHADGLIGQMQEASP